jgi:excisionase family DNA binding protein
MQQLAYNIAQAAEAACVSEPTMRKLVNTDGFPALRVGRRWVIPVESFNAWLVQQASMRTCIEE